MGGKISIFAKYITLWCMVIGLVILADWLFYERQVGWTTGLFTAVMIDLLWFRHPHAALRKGVWPITLLGLGLVVAMIIEPGGLEIVLAVIMIVSLAMAMRLPWTSSAWQWFARWGEFAAVGWSRFFRDLRWMKPIRLGSRRKSIGAIFIIRGMILLAFTGLFTLLFVAANPIIEQWAQAPGRWLDRILANLDFDLARILSWAFVLVMSWAVLRLKVRHWPSLREQLHLPAASGPPGLILTPRFITQCLIVFNVLFAVQTALDAMFLWGGSALPEGMTYAQYAQRGSYPLVAATLLAGLFVIGSFNPRFERSQIGVARKLVYMWIAQNMLLLISAAMRLGMYVEVYSLSRWRIAAIIWMAVIVIGFLWLVIRIATERDNRWLIGVNLITALAVMYACCFVNFDRIIADFNVRHCRQITGNQSASEIDIAYLQALGPESIAALDWLDKQEISGELHVSVRMSRAKLIRTFRKQMDGWRGWTLRRQCIWNDVTHPQPD